MASYCGRRTNGSDQNSHSRGKFIFSHDAPFSCCYKVRSQRWLEAGSVPGEVNRPRFCSPAGEECRRSGQSSDLGATVTEVKATLNSAFLLGGCVFPSSRGAPPRWPPITPASWCSPPRVGQPGDLLLVTRIQQKSGGVTSRMRLLKVAASVLDPCSPPRREASCRVVSCRGETHVAGNSGRPFASSSRGTGPPAALED